MEIERCLKDYTIFIHQKKYLIQLFDLFGFYDNPDGSFHSEMFPVDSPMEANIKLESFTGAKAEKYTGPYREKIGKLLFLSMVSRPEIVQAVGKLARYNADPRVGHNHAVCRIIAYLMGTVNEGITLGGKESLEILTYVDAAMNTDPGLKAISGFVIYLNKSPVIWCSKKQVLTATSTMESELDSMAMVTPHSLWTRDIVLEMSSTFKPNCLITYEDNQSTIQHVKKRQASWKTVHLARRYHWLKQQQEMGAIKLVYCPTEHMIADLFTKPLAVILFHKFAGQLITTPDGGNPFLKGPQGSQFRAKQLGPHDWRLQLQAEANFAWASFAHKLQLQAWQQGKLTGAEWADCNETVVQTCMATALMACGYKVLGSGAISSSVSRANSSHSLDAAETASILEEEQHLEGHTAQLQDQLRRAEAAEAMLDLCWGGMRQ